ncbi:Oidioi.mRNA.OKI2018_I69.PAR.g12044.t1.cds [Oikopleura dioica]|uniref:Oidioi.mRNA.OKI2018_I69.PAR.g12044.t1.cds n=1 Tax=Oikopleura dioica TaxID=34765 RepID=A0ABN7S240_OIKDI|nr:Oidioi.mRNA.OKI2018_I69.PAR.g12044.t1.cds [Oikopleura dioica]
MSLVPGTIPLVFNREVTSSDGPVYVLLIVSRELNKSATTRRLRGKLTDGKYESQMTVIVTDKQLEKGDLLKVKHWNITGSAEKMLFQIEEFEVETKNFPLPKSGTTKIWKYGQPFDRPSKSVVAAPKKKVNVPGAPARGKENAKPATADGRFMSIMTLTPYMNKWVIKARVTQKSALKEYQNAKGAGKLFSFTVEDGTCDLKISAFNDEVDKFMNIIEKGKVITISNGSLKPKNPQYNRTKHDYECTLGRNTAIEEVMDDDGDIPEMSFDFENISKIIAERAKGAFVDRDLEVVDDSTKEKLRCTLWGKQAVEFNAERGQVLAVKGASVGEFQGKTLSVGRDSEIVLDFTEKDGERLRVWWQQEGQDSTFEGQSGANTGGGKKNQMVTLDALMHGANYETEGDKPYWFNSKCYLTYIKKDRMVYKGCVGKEGTGCNKKLIEEDDGTYRCEKCNSNFQDFNYRIMMNAAVTDGRGQHFCTFFGDTAEQILDISSKDLGEMFMSDGNEFDDFINTKSCLEFILGGRAKSEIYQDEQRLRVAAQRVAQIDYNKYGMDLINRMKEFENKSL